MNKFGMNQTFYDMFFSVMKTLCNDILYLKKNVKTIKFRVKKFQEKKTISMKQIHDHHFVNTKKFIEAVS